MRELVPEPPSPPPKPRSLADAMAIATGDSTRPPSMRQEAVLDDVACMVVLSIVTG